MELLERASMHVFSVECITIWKESGCASSMTNFEFCRDRPHSMELPTLVLMYSWFYSTYLSSSHQGLILHGRLVVPVHGRNSRIIDVDLHGHHAARKRHNIIHCVTPTFSKAAQHSCLFISVENAFRVHKALAQSLFANLRQLRQSQSCKCQQLRLPEDHPRRTQTRLD